MNFKEFTKYIFDNNLTVYWRQGNRILVKENNPKDKRIAKKRVIKVNFDLIGNDKLWE